jgi:hypothetical protein
LPATGAGAMLAPRTGDCSRGNDPMRMVAGCLVAVMTVIAYDAVMHDSRYRTAAGKMVGHMMSVTWRH